MSIAESGANRSWRRFGSAGPAGGAAAPSLALNSNMDPDEECAMTDPQGDDQQPRRREIAIGEIIPPAWHEQQVWISSYRAYGLQQSSLIATKPFELLNVRGQLFWGGAPVPRSKMTMQPQADGSVIAELQIEGVGHAQDGPYLMLITPTEFRRTPMAEEDTRSRFPSVVALLRLALGRNLAVEPLGDLIFVVSTSTATVVEPGFRPPGLDPAPDLSPSRLGLVAGIDQAIDRLNKQHRDRVELSLQWFFAALDSFGVEGFLLSWFALDTLAMPKPSGATTFEKQLAGIYELDLSEVQRQFRIGRFKNVRDRITHEGRRPVIHYRVLDFVHALYWDALLDILGLGAPRAAGQVPRRTSMSGFPARPEVSRAPSVITIG